MRILLALLLCSCQYIPRATLDDGDSAACVYERSPTFGPAGTVPVRAETVVSGLEVPWGVVFLPGGDLIISERPGRLRLVRGGKLVPAPIATLQTGEAAEGGLLSIALHPRDPSLLYLYVTVPGPANRVERWRLAPDHASAQRDKVIFAGIKSGPFHNGGRIKFGPDGMLWIGTGDARTPDLAQDPQSPNGKILRLTPDGEPAPGNPIAGNPLFALGVRNCEAFDWLDPATLILADHGPSGEMLRSGNDEVDVATAGANLGWPGIYGCQQHQGWVSPVLAFKEAMPPGGAVFYRGDAIPEWKDSFLIGTLKSKHLHRVVLDASHRVTKHEVYFLSQLGRIRDVVVSPDGALYLTTSNCDSRGDCPPEKDKLVRVLRD